MHCAGIGLGHLLDDQKRKRHRRQEKTFLGHRHSQSDYQSLQFRLSFSSKPAMTIPRFLVHSTPTSHVFTMNLFIPGFPSKSLLVELRARARFLSRAREISPEADRTPLMSREPEAAFLQKRGAERTRSPCARRHDRVLIGAPALQGLHTTMAIAHGRYYRLGSIRWVNGVILAALTLRVTDTFDFATEERGHGHLGELEARPEGGAENPGASARGLPSPV